MADAEAVVAGIAPRPGVLYTGLWLNERGFERARATGRLDMRGTIVAGASSTFLKRNQNRTIEEQFEAQRALVARYKALGVPVTRGGVMAAFGCNDEGAAEPARVVALVGEILAIARDHDVTLDYVSFADTMGWATPLSVKRLIGAAQDAFPHMEWALHLHDTRGLGLANAYAGLEMGVARFDAAVAGLGGCPFAGNAGAAGNVCTEDLVFMCEEMGIETGVDLDKLIACALLAEEIVGHPLPGAVKIGGSLARLRAAMRSA
jgi:hydroxymethylglutaryl-CoA lyase